MDRNPWQFCKNEHGEIFSHNDEGESIEKEIFSLTLTSRAMDALTNLPNSQKARVGLG